MAEIAVLHDYLDLPVAGRSAHTAVEEADGAKITYGELGRLSDALRDRLLSMGVRPGDRVGVWVRKSIDAVAAIYGILKAGAAYVPVDPTAPAGRNGYIFSNCSIRTAIVEDRYAAALRSELTAAGQDVPLIEIEGAGGGLGLRRRLDALQSESPAPHGTTIRPAADDLAYILYTSGSTGKPKGVMLSHGNAMSFIEWCSETFEPSGEERFSAHAPFHFDLSILDLFLPAKHGATLVVIGEELGKEPTQLAQFIAESRISSWYSAPSILSLLVERGKLREYDYGNLRRVLFAGEVFPIVRLNALRHLWPLPVYYNLYGPTETNVCTYFQVPADIEDSRTEPYPIGKICSHLSGVAIDASGNPVLDGSEGELCIAGPGVMLGYWGQPEQTENAYYVSEDEKRYYRTGDIVAREEGGSYRYLGRRDRMIKKRGYRVELDEIEACLYLHPEIDEAAVVAVPHDELGQMIRAHLSIRGAERMSIIKLKRFCSEHLPIYMIPDQFSFHPALPKTSTGKTNYQELKQYG